MKFNSFNKLQILVKKGCLTAKKVPGDKTMGLLQASCTNSTVLF